MQAPINFRGGHGPPRNPPVTCLTMKVYYTRRRSDVNVGKPMVFFSFFFLATNTDIIIIIYVQLHRAYKILDTCGCCKRTESAVMLLFLGEYFVARVHYVYYYNIRRPLVVLRCQNRRCVNKNHCFKEIKRKGKKRSLFCFFLLSLYVFL